MSFEPIRPGVPGLAAMVVPSSAGDQIAYLVGQIRSLQTKTGDRPPHVAVSFLTAALTALLANDDTGVLSVALGKAATSIPSHRVSSTLAQWQRSLML